jgi:LuxR family maltose regulon positive regulatory protein
VDEGAPVGRLLYNAVARGIAPDYAGKLLAAFPDAELTPVGQSRSQLAKFKILEPLSKREFEVLQSIADGLSNDEIAQSLSISLSTVKSHAFKIYSKLDVNSRTQAIAKAGALGILPSP